MAVDNFCCGREKPSKTKQNMSKNENKIRAGKLGAEKRWASRHELLISLSAKYGKDFQEQFLKWPTKHLEQLLRWVESVK